MTEMEELKARVAELEKRIVDVVKLHELVLGAGQDGGVRAAAERKAKLLARHLKAVE
jgi:hypothetical protein